MVDSVLSSDILGEVIFLATRSSGAGGQHVNKVSTRITLRWNVANSQLLTIDQRNWLLQKWSTLLTSTGELLISAQESRSQLSNKQEAIRKLDELLKAAFARKKVRKPTKPGKATRKKRLDSKKRNAEKKQMRKKI